jgi:hypothetical protein
LEALPRAWRKPRVHQSRSRPPQELNLPPLFLILAKSARARWCDTTLCLRMLATPRWKLKTCSPDAAARPRVAGISGSSRARPLQLNSDNFGGAITKSATVSSNDPGKSKVVLQFTGTVWKPIEVTPTTAVFNVSGESQTNVTKVVRIVNNLEEPLKLSDPKCTNQVLRAELKTVRPDKEFELHITAVPPFPATSVGAPVTLKTSSEKMPTISVTAYLAVQQAVAVMPNHIVLPAGPLAKAMSPKVKIRSNGTDSLVLSEASVNIPEAEVRLEETQPGRLFNLAVSFPAGFQIQPDQKVEVTLKSNHPEFPLIKVPVVQSKSPAAAATPRVEPPNQVLPTKEESSVAGGK